MKAQLPHQFDKLRMSTSPEHYSYQLHRKQRNTQIILPMVLGAVVLIGLIVLISLAAFKSNGDVGRWAAISTMWILIPVLLVGLIVLIVLIALIYLMAQALSTIPYYTGIGQDYVYKARGYIIRGANMVTKPMIALGGFAENIKAFLERMNKS